MTAARRVPLCRHPESGSVTIWMVGVVAISFLLLALVLDGGTMLRARSDAFAAAGAAAREGAQALDPDAAVEGEPILDPAAAEVAALERLRADGLQGTAAVQGATVTVTVYSEARLQLLTLAGGDTATFTAVASATAQVSTP